MIIETDEYVDARTAAKLKGFNQTGSFLYHINCKKNTPQPIRIGAHLFWNREDLVKWTPTRDKRGPTPKPNGAFNGETRS